MHTKLKRLNGNLAVRLCSHNDHGRIGFESCSRFLQRIKHLIFFKPIVFGRTLSVLLSLLHNADELPVWRIEGDLNPAPTPETHSNLNNPKLFHVFISFPAACQLSLIVQYIEHCIYVFNGNVGGHVV